MKRANRYRCDECLPPARRAAGIGYLARQYRVAASRVPYFDVAAKQSARMQGLSAAERLSVTKQIVQNNEPRLSPG
jgi:hypothetical protein